MHHFPMELQKKNVSFTEGHESYVEKSNRYGRYALLFLSAPKTIQTCCPDWRLVHYNAPYIEFRDTNLSKSGMMKRPASCTCAHATMRRVRGGLLAMIRGVGMPICPCRIMLGCMGMGIR